MTQKNSLLKNESITVETISPKRAAAFNSEAEIRFDVSKLNESDFKKILLYFDDVSSAPIEYLLTGLLSCLSGAIGKKVYFNITESLKIYLNVWAIIIGRSTVMKKTTAINLVKDDLSRINKKSYKEYLQRLEYYNNLEPEKRKEAKEPVRDYYLFPNDSTIESLINILSVSERGLLVHSEFGSFLKQLDRSYSADSKQFFTNIYDVPDTYEVTRMTRGNTLISKPFLSILGASTIDWLKNGSQESDLRTGFLARFIYSIRNVPDKKYISLFDLSSITKQSKIYIDTRELFERLTGNYEGAGFSITEETELSISDEAKELYKSFDIKTFETEILNGDNENEVSFKARLLFYAAKFSGIIALSNQRYNVTLEDMQDSLLITEYFKKNITKLLDSELTKDEFTRKEERVIFLIKKFEGNIKRSDLLSYSKYKPKELDELLNGLVQKEMIEEHFERGSGKKAAKYYRMINK